MTAWQWYDENAGVYEELDLATLEFGRVLLDYADPAPGARLLDVGAGRGAVTRVALDRHCVVTAVDAAPGMVRRLSLEFPTTTVVRMDAQRLDFPAAYFDVVTAGFVLDILPDPRAALAEVRRVLRPGGVVALSMPGPLPHRERWQWLVDLAREFYPAAMRADPDGYVPMEVPELLASAGFAGVTSTTFELPVPVRDAEALWEMFAGRLPTAVAAGWVDQLPPDRAAAFKRGFLVEAQRMQASGGIAMDRYVLLHRALRP